MKHLNNLPNFSQPAVSWLSSGRDNDIASEVKEGLELKEPLPGDA